MNPLRHRLKAALSAVLAAGMIFSTLSGVAAVTPLEEAPAELTGAGTTESPFRIATEADYHLFANELNAGNEKYTGADKVFAITEDLFFTEQPPMINTFEGTLDGTGHSILGLTLQGAITDGSYRLALIGENKGGTVKNLAVDTPSVIATGWTSDSGPLIGIFSAKSTNAHYENCAIIDASISASEADKVAGFAAENNGSTVKNCYFTGTVNAGLQPGAIFGYSKGKTTNVENCYVEADLTTSKYSGPIAAYPNTITVTNCVVGGGSSTCTRDQEEMFNGRLIGTYEKFANNFMTNNYVDETFTINDVIALGGKDPNSKLGADADETQLSSQSFYEETMGWDFESVWKWNESTKRPTLQYVDVGHRPDRITVTFNGDAKTRKGFTWYTSGTTEQPVVQVSTSSDLSEAAEATAVMTETKNGYMYKAVAENLTPGTTYYYRVGDKASDIWSSIGSFVTAPESGGFTFINLTDTQAKNSGEAQLSANTIAKALSTVSDAEFIIHGGDFVQTGDDESMWKDMLNFSKSSLMNTTIVPTAGNHEEQDNTFINHFNVETPNEQDASTGAYYSFDYGPAHFAVLNTNEDAAQAVSQAQLDWLRADVTAARERGAKWIILNTHKGPYTTAEHVADADVMAMRQVLVPLIDELDIDLVLQGHDHILARTKVLQYDEDGEAYGKVAETSQFTEIRNGKRIDYAMNPDGTIYALMDTAGAKHYEQNSNPTGIDMDEYLELFDRSSQDETCQYFAGITVTDTSLETMVYQIRDEATPMALEGFGIDREVQPVIDAIEALPAVDAVTAENTEAVEAVYADYNALRDAQQAAVSNSDKLFDLLARLFEMGQVDDSLIQWADDTATARQSIAVRNDTDKAFADAPVLLKLKNIPEGTAQNTLKFYTTEGLALSYEVENWDTAGTTTVWVKVPEIPADSAAYIWAYYGGAEAQSDPTDVWSDDYQLVDHFDSASEDGTTRTDSTGKQTGTVTGNLTTAVQTDGTVGAHFENAKVTYGAIGSDYDSLSVSALFSATEEDLDKILGTDAALISRDMNASNENNTDAFFLGFRPTQKTAVARYNGVWWENGTIINCETVDQTLPIDGSLHLMTLTYDGMTVYLYIDGVEVYNAFAEDRSTLLDAALQTTIGAYSDEGLVNAFCGTMDEVQLAGAAFTPEWESFRYKNYLGDAVAYGAIEQKTENPLVLTIAEPKTGVTIESGSIITVTGMLNKPATLQATLDGTVTELGEMPMGVYSVQLPVNGLEEQILVLQATGRDNAAQTATATVTLQVADTVAPGKPVAEDSSYKGTVQGDSATLTAHVETDSAEKLTAQFYQNAVIPLSDANAVLYAGTTTATLPDDLKPGDGVKQDSLYTATTGADVNPYQIYEITLTEEQQAASKFGFTWKGSTQRQVTSYVYNYDKEEWVQTGSAYDKDTEQGTINMRIENENVVQDGKLYLLIWRGMTEDVSEMTDFKPSAGEYDFSYIIVPDTQLYAQSYPDRALKQFEWLADNYDDVKGKMVLSVGDVVNRPYLSEEYQWVNMDAAYKILEDRDIPYAIAWGNHDYDDGTNNRIMYKKYFSAERLEAAGGSYWVDSNDNDNVCYLMEENGAKLMILTVGYWAHEGDYAWAKQAIEAHPDYSVILVTHKYITRYGELQDADAEKFREELVEPYTNVKMVLNGHDHGSNVHYEVFGEGTEQEHAVWSVVTDYQRAPEGGDGWLRNMHIDLENNLVYFNSYSPITGSDAFGFNREPVTETPGMYKVNMEEFVLPVDFGGTSARTLETSSLTMTCGEAQPVGEPQSITGNQKVSVEMEGLVDGMGYEWFVTVTDQAGHTAQSDVMYFEVKPADTAALTETIAAAEALDLTFYEDAGKEEFQAALDAAKALLEQENPQQQAVDEADARLQTAMEALTLKPVDKSALQALVDEANALDLDLYEDAGKEEFQAALAEAEQILILTEADQQTVNDSVERLQAAMDALKPVAAADGDMDADGTVDIQDVMLACRVLARSNAAQKPSDEELAHGDLDGDKKVTISDIMLICRILARTSAK